MPDEHLSPIPPPLQVHDADRPSLCPSPPLPPVQVLEVALPEDIERLRHSRKVDNSLSDRLELSDDAACGLNSIELGWRPPTKNAERIEKYKLMIATSTGVVKDVYQVGE